MLLTLGQNLKYSDKMENNCGYIEIIIQLL